VPTTGRAGCALRGLDARLIAGHFVTPYRMQGRRGKNDANDAAAICEAASRPHMRFVPVKSAEQQALLAVHRLREGFKEDRTACINRIRGLLAEFGLVFPQSPQALRQAAARHPGGRNNELPRPRPRGLRRAHAAVAGARMPHRVVRRAHRPHARPTSARRPWRLDRHRPRHRLGAGGQRGRLRQFDDRRRQFGAWLGLTPSPDSSGGKASLGRITKRGDDYLANPADPGGALGGIHRPPAQRRLSRWLLALRERRGWQKAAVALANKNARIVWAILTRGECFDADHVPEVPATKQAKPRVTVPAAAPAMTGTPVMAG
jgi:transposase